VSSKTTISGIGCAEVRSSWNTLDMLFS
jgi:hypothetical protein